MLERKRLCSLPDRNMLVLISEQAASAQKTILVEGIFIDGPAIASLFLAFLTPPNVLSQLGQV